MDLHLDTDAFSKASKELDAKCQELKLLSSSIKDSFEQLRGDWDSDAGRRFFERFEGELIKNLEDYSLVFGHMSKNLSTASQKYEEVFTVANKVANTRV